jgi:hypothetical protein
MNAPTVAPVSLEQLVERILTSRKITRLDQHALLALSKLNSQECALINRVFDRLRLGLLKVVD